MNDDPLYLAAIKAANTEDKTWKPYMFERVHNGLIAHGCSTTQFVRGYRKGETKYLTKENPLTVVVTFSMVDDIKLSIGCENE